MPIKDKHAPLPATWGGAESGRRVTRPGPGRRTGGPAVFSLVELPPELVVRGEPVASGFMADDVTPVGAFRELCPHCQDVPLTLVLRDRHVIRSHLFCKKCTRCFDALDPDGVSAITPVAVPIA